MLCVSACDEDTEVERNGAARIHPRVVVDASMLTAVGTAEIAVENAPEASELKFALTAADGRYTHVWQSVDDYPDNELLRPGTYTAGAFNGSYTTEGFDTPQFLGTKQLWLESGADTDVEITAQLASTAFRLEVDDRLASTFASAGVMLHTEGYSYIYYPSTETRTAYLLPGKVDIALDVTDTEGNRATIDIACVDDAKARHLYTVRLEGDGSSEPTVTALVDGVEAGKVSVDQSLLRAKAPEITCHGFTPGMPYTLAEGNTPESPLLFTIGQAEASSLTLATVAPSLTSEGWPAQIDLATCSSDELNTLQSMGLRLERNTAGTITAVDLTDVAARLRYSSLTPDSRFILMAKGPNGKLSQPAQLDIELTPVEIKIVSVSDIIIGTGVGEVTLVSHSASLDDNMVIEASDDNGNWPPCPIEAIERRGEADYAVRFKVPAGTDAQLPIRVKYCGNVVAEATVRRVAPEFGIEVDAYALSAMVRVVCDDESLRPLITSLLQIYVNGSPTFTGYRHPQQGLAYIGSLEPNKTYSVRASLLSNPSESDFTPALSIRTEHTLQVTNSNFEDHHDGVKYENMPSGGRYSQSIVDIFNRQNYRTYKEQEPRDWANTNTKTFCKAARNHNTWYMNPSVVSDLDNVEGYFAVKLQSVAWDLDGAAIKDYRQKPGEFLAYNPNIPNIRYRAAGKVFLGRYEFDPSTLREVYTEGISFGSRPVAVNGNYHFTPGINDIGENAMIEVEVLGMVNGAEISLAHNKIKLQPAMTYTAFTVPLTYDHFGVKATKLKIMLSSSEHSGTIEYESAHITTTPDPVTATSIGGTLWVQDLTLSYI